jgi:methionyl-tRNA formyltransferase
LRTAYLGTSEFAVAVLRRLAASSHRPELVITRPDRAQGRGRRLAPPPVARAARELGIEVEQPESAGDAAPRERLARLRPEAICVCAYGALIREPLLSEYPMFNVHPSLLPRWRGAAPIERAIMAGDDRTGVSIIRLTAGLDSGPICAQVDEAIASEDTYGRLSARLAALGGELLVGTLDGLPECVAQDESQATYADKVLPEDRQLDPTRHAIELERTVRALSPHVGAWVKLPDGGRLGVTEARAVPCDGARPGELLLRAGEEPAIACSEGALELRVVKPPGRREMSGQAWLRGWRT